MSDNAKKSAIELSELTVKFLTTDSQSSTELKSSLELLEIELERFPLFTAGSTLMVRFAAFAETVTGGDFESSTRTKKLPDSLEVNAVFRARNELLAEIEHQFKVHYC